VLKHVLFVIDYKILAIHGEGKQRILLQKELRAKLDRHFAA